LLLPQRKERIDRVLANRTRSFTLVLDRLGDPHNLSAILRTCEGFGVQDVHVVSEMKGFTANPKISQGAEKWLDVHLHRSMSVCASVLSAQGFTLCVSDFGEGAEPLHALPLESKLALVLGNEVDGVSDEARTLAARRFVIPMMGFAQSYNVGITAAICLSLMRERRREKGIVGDLSPAEHEMLRKRFYELAVNQGGRIYGED
jgi:tRNA (guanosine-2'-O-)-methyltransferase